MKYLLAVPALLLRWHHRRAHRTVGRKRSKRAGVKRCEITRRVPAGKPRVLEDAIYLNADCTTVTKEPQHGTATIKTHQRNPSYPKDSVRPSAMSAR